MFWLLSISGLMAWSEFFQMKIKVLCNLTQMKSLLIVKMCNKATIFKKQLDYFPEIRENSWDINKLWAHREVLGKSVMLITAHGGSVRDGNYALYTCIVIYMFFTIYWVNSCSNVHVYVEISLINGVVLEFTTVLLLSIFICRFYGTTGSCGAGIYIAQKCLPHPFFMHKNI
jgi:hypothetical protein